MGYQMRGRVQGLPQDRPEMQRAAQVMRGPRAGMQRNGDQAFTLSFSALAIVTLTTLSAGLVIISWV